MAKEALIGRRLVGDGAKPYIIAEIGANHNGDLETAKKLIDTAVDCGADAVKFQSWSSKSLISREEYERNTAYADKKKHFGTLREMVEEYQLSEADHEVLRNYCGERIDFVSSAFSREEVALLSRIDAAAIKIASMDVNYIDLLEAAGSSGRPVILSTGMATLGEIDRAVQTVQQSGATDVVLLHCISIYPPAMETVNLRNIPMLREAYDLPIGFSDHSIGIALPLASVALGACVIEKHFTLDKTMAGWDHAISADPAELRAICKEASNVYTALGRSMRVVSEAEMAKRNQFRRSVVATRDMKAGETVSKPDLTCKRPGTGIGSDKEALVVGRRLKRDVRQDDLLQWSDFI